MHLFLLRFHHREFERHIQSLHHFLNRRGGKEALQRSPHLFHSTNWVLLIKLENQDFLQIRYTFHHRLQSWVNGRVIMPFPRYECILGWDQSTRSLSEDCKPQETARNLFDLYRQSRDLRDWKRIGLYDTSLKELEKILLSKSLKWHCRFAKGFHSESHQRQRPEGRKSNQKAIHRHRHHREEWL